MNPINFPAAGSNAYVTSIGPSPTALTAGQTAPASSAASTASSFGDMLMNAIGQVNQAQLHANHMRAEFAAGKPLDVHQVMVASEEASMSLDLAVQVRNKLTDAYTQLMQVNM